MGDLLELDNDLKERNFQMLKAITDAQAQQAPLKSPSASESVADAAS